MMKRKISALLSAFGVLLLLAACSPADGPAPLPPPKGHFGEEVQPPPEAPGENSNGEQKSN